jgi:hypothetical protein
LLGLWSIIVANLEQFVERKHGQQCSKNARFPFISMKIAPAVQSRSACLDHIVPADAFTSKEVIFAFDGLR